MRRCVIIGGAEIRTYNRVRQYFRPDDFFIYCDCGLRHQKALGAEPDLIVGDFDSHEKPETDRETIVLPVKKDDTDTVFAAKEAMRRGFDEFLLVGVSGGRLDHTLVNVYLLVMLREQGKRALLVDDYSEMELVGAEPVEIPERFPFYSLVNITGTARGITETGCKFPLDNGEIHCGYQYGTPRIQYTPASFVEPAARIFGHVMGTTVKSKKPEGFFPAPVSLDVDAPDVVRSRFYTPIFQFAERGCNALKILQNGRVNMYILYILVTLVALLIWGIA